MYYAKKQSNYCNKMLTMNEKEKKFELICEKLKDDNCFLNMDIEHSYAVLRDLGIEESSVKAIYSDLISR